MAEKRGRTCRERRLAASAAYCPLEAVIRRASLHSPLHPEHTRPARIQSTLPPVRGHSSFACGQPVRTWPLLHTCLPDQPSPSLPARRSETGIVARRLAAQFRRRLPILGDATTCPSPFPGPNGATSTGTRPRVLLEGLAHGLQGIRANLGSLDSGIPSTRFRPALLPTRNRLLGEVGWPEVRSSQQGSDACLPSCASLRPVESSPSEPVRGQGSQSSS